MGRNSVQVTVRGGAPGKGGSPVQRSVERDGGPSGGREGERIPKSRTGRAANPFGDPMHHIQHGSATHIRSMALLTKRRAGRRERGGGGQRLVEGPRHDNTPPNSVCKTMHTVQTRDGQKILWTLCDVRGKKLGECGNGELREVNEHCDTF